MDDLLRLLLGYKELVRTPEGWFNAHLDHCTQCRHHPEQLCERGRRLTRDMVERKLPV